MLKLNQLLIFLFGALVFNGNIYGQDSNEISTREIILRAFEKGQQHMDISTYPGTLLLHGMSEFSLLKGNEEQLNLVIEALAKFGSGDIKAAGNFISYEATILDKVRSGIDIWAKSVDYPMLDNFYN